MAGGCEPDHCRGTGRGRQEVKIVKKTHDRSRKTFWTASAHSILMGVILFGSVTWAWFSEIVDAPDITVETAGYGIRAEVSGNGAVISNREYGSVTDGDHLVVEVESGIVHDITLTGLGTAEWNGGYCVVSAGDNVRYTQRIKPGEMLKFQILFSGTENGRIEFLPYWGFYPDGILEEGDGGNEVIKDIYVIKNEENDETDGKYVVSGGDFVVSGGDEAGGSAG